VYSYLLLSPLHFNKLEFHPLKDYLCQIWLKLAQWFWRGRFLNDPIPSLHFCDYLLIEENPVLYLNKFQFPSPNDHVYQV
jgi:hypothetical protein